MATGERLHALDALRASAMLLGIVLHAATSFIVTPFPWIVHDVSRSFAFDAMLGAIHGFRMPLFFFLAGFFAHLLFKRYGTKAFLRHRALRIGVPFLVGLATLVPATLALWVWALDYQPPGSPPAQGPRLTVLAYPTMHLWFLEMLLALYLVAVLIARTGAALTGRLEALFDRFIASWWKPLVLVPPTVLVLWHGPIIGEVDFMGRSLLPGPRSIGYFGLFFAVGWWLHIRAHQLASLQRWLPLYFAAALVAFLAGGACHLMPKSTLVRLAGNTAAALYAWTMVFALTGVFLRFAGAHRPWVRYLADASYWMYLCHLPIVMWLQVLVAPLAINGSLKLFFILAVTTPILFATYHWLVRRSFVGFVLNGPRPQAA